MLRKSIATWGMILLLLASVFGSAAAQTVDDPETVPSVTPTVDPTTLKFYSHPVVQILSAYFGRLGVEDPDATPTESATPDPDATVDPNATPTAEPTDLPLTPEQVAAQIAQYHAEGMGFGVLVKLYSVAEGSVQKCADLAEKAGPVDPAAAPVEPCVPVTVDELVTAFQGGQGMGNIYKEYGKPAMLGVGHVKKWLKNNPEGEPTDPALTADPDGDLEDEDETELESQDDKGPKDKGPKDKPPKANKPPKPKKK